MVVSLSFIVALLFFSTCYSGASPSALPCNISFEIQWPFSFCNDFHTGPPCPGPIMIGCHGTDPVIFIFGPEYPNYWFQLENISYTNSVLIVRDDNLSQSLRHSNCRNVTIDFEPPIDDFNPEKYQKEHDGFSSIHCDPKTHHVPNDFCEEDHHNCSYPIEEMNSSVICSGSQSFSFEWTFSFHNPTGILTLLSASIFPIDPSLLPDCGPRGEAPLPSKGNMSEKKTIILGIAGASIFIFTCLLFISIQRYKSCVEYIFSRKCKPQGNIEMLLEKYGSLTPKRYKYGEVKKITHSFQDILGKGGFGTVYKGTLQDGRLVAVKILHNYTSNGDEFFNEVISIGKTSHVNVVSLLGFCINGKKHALIYEYMPNGSLDNYIYSEKPKTVLGWEKLYGIAIGIARGLEYLHRGCNARIVHFDIKPQNILLDEKFTPKIADFGLAKLCSPEVSILSMAEMRGTIGFIAPEVFSRSFGVISAKSDVYSYGMMLLEMVGGRRNAKQSAENPSQVYFPHWLYDRLDEGSAIQTCDVEPETEEVAKKMGIVGLWCTQTMPNHRPSMSRVLEMLEKGLNELDMPPKPYLSSPSHTTILSNSFSTLS